MNTKLVSAIGLALLVSASAFAQSPSGGNDPATPATPAVPATPATSAAPDTGQDALAAADRRFLDEALASGETEIHAAKLAQARGMDEDVRELAQLIERDHRDLNAKLEAAGARADHAGGKRHAAPATTPATTPGTESADSANAVGGAGAADPAAASEAANALSADPHMKPLLSARGAAFDAAYLDMLVQMHRMSIEKFETAANGQEHSAEVRTLAQQALPSLRRHASMAESLDQAMAKE
jgi:putative membrane protein